MAARQPTSINVHNDKTRRHEKDIRIGQAILFFDERKNAWVSYAGHIIKNEEGAIKLATAIDILISAGLKK